MFEERCVSCGEGGDGHVVALDVQRTFRICGGCVEAARSPAWRLAAVPEALVPAAAALMALSDRGWVDDSTEGPTTEDGADGVVIERIGRWILEWGEWGSFEVLPFATEGEAERFMRHLPC